MSSTEYESFGTEDELGEDYSSLMAAYADAQCSGELEPDCLPNIVLMSEYGYWRLRRRLGPPFKLPRKTKKRIFGTRARNRRKLATARKEHDVL